MGGVMSDIHLKKYKTDAGLDIYADDIENYYLAIDIDPIIAELDKLKVENEKLREIIFEIVIKKALEE